jgi:aconitate hydratase
VPALNRGRCRGPQEIVLESPYGDELPQRGFDPGEETFQAPPPPGQRAGVQVVVEPTSSRLQLLDPFKAWHGDDIKVGCVCV